MSSRPLAMQFPVYQIDFSAVAAGKRVAATKRRIRWCVSEVSIRKCRWKSELSSHRMSLYSLFLLRRFGFPNLKALEAGRTGTDCRGEEHEIVIIWSVTSGKRQIIMDGREIHFSANRVGLIDYSWNTKGNHVLKTICHAAPPMSATPGFRQYDLLIDGQSFFRMPKVYELGVKGISAMENRMPGQYPSYAEVGGSPQSGYSGYAGAGYGGSGGYSEPPVRAPRSSSEEDAELQRAIKESLEESKRHLEVAEGKQSAPDVLSGGDAAPAGGATADLLDFDGPSFSSATPAIMPDPSSYASGVPQPQQYGDAGSAYGPSTQSYGDAGSAYSAPQSYGAPPPPQQQQYLALPPSQPAYGAPPPSPGYGAPPPQQPQYAALPPSQPGYGSPPPQQQQQQWSQQQNQFAPQPSYGQPPATDPYAGHSIDDPFAPRAPTHRDVANDILKAYAGAGTPTSVVGFNGSQQDQGYYQPGQPFPANGTQGGYDEPHHMNGNAPNLSMNGLALTESGEEPKNPFEATLKKLVNFDHIDQPAEEKLKLTMKQQEDERAKKNRNKSAPLPPAAARMVGSGATLREISTVKPPTKKELVVVPPPGLFQGDAAMAGAMVVHGQGPPPLQPRGFGVVHMQGQYPAQQHAAYSGPPQQQGYGYGYR
jgi:hypothetical protein